MTSISRVRLIASAGVIALIATTAVLLTSSGGAATACLAKKNLATAKLKNVQGDSVGKVTFGIHSTCKTKVTVSLSGITEGFHGFHIHTTGICDPAATDPSGATVPFYSAGGHFNPAATDHGAHAGDLPPALGMDTGAARTWFLTSRFQITDLDDDDGSAVIVHAGADNLANIPAATASGGERYHSHAYDTMGADEDSKKTGDAGARFACGVIERNKKD
jgi:Cu-Zn family superoxide dismutase